MGFTREPVASDASKIRFFVGNGVGIVFSFVQRGEEVRQVGEITYGISNPSGLLDRKGDLYVANLSNGYVPVYHVKRGETKPFLTLNLPTPSVGAGDLAVDPRGRVYVTSFNQSSIYVYPPNSNTFTSVLTDSIDPNLWWIAGDSKGDMFVSGFGKTLEEFKAGASQPTRLPITYEMPGGLAVDDNDDLLVCDGGSGSTGTIALYAPPYTGKPIYAFAYNGSAAGCAFGSDGAEVFVANNATDAGEVYAVPSGTLLASTSAIAGATGVAVLP